MRCNGRHDPTPHMLIAGNGITPGIFKLNIHQGIVTVVQIGVTAGAHLLTL
ncbi:MAG: hypothetical protein O7G88_00450 [bacterium]|nr:hypothetical protein [bacterium]